MLEVTIVDVGLMLSGARIEYAAAVREEIGEGVEDLEEEELKERLRASKGRIVRRRVAVGSGPPVAQQMIRGALGMRQILPKVCVGRIELLEP